MIQSLETLGLRVEGVTPGKYELGISVNSELRITFNSELDTDTIQGNFFVLKDPGKTYIRGNILNVKDYEVVQGLVTYKDKTIIFSPTGQLDNSTRYIIYVRKNRVCDIIGNAMIQDYISYFDTEDIASYGLPNIIQPANNSILKELNLIEFEDVGSYRYVIQISKFPTFENIFLEEIVDGIFLDREFNLGDGLYYVRVKAENGDYGEANVFSIKTFRDTAPTDEDIDDAFIYEPYDVKELELIDSFPKLDEIQVSRQLNCCYLKFNSIIPIEDINFEDATFYGNYVDEDDQFNDKLSADAKLHGERDGSFSVVYDEENEETYVFFIPTNL